MASKLRVKAGDTVKVLSGKERGKRGKVLNVFTRDARVLIEGVNLKKKHRRARRQDRKGEIILLPAPVPASNVQVVCPSCGKPTRLGYRLGSEGKKSRFCKACGTDIR